MATNAQQEVQDRLDYIERMLAEMRPIDNGTLTHLVVAYSEAVKELAQLRAVVCAVADAFEPEMDAHLAFDERSAVKACRSMVGANKY